MNKIVPILFLVFLHFITKGQYCTSNNRFTETPIFTDNQIQLDSMVFANALDWQGVNQTLKLNVFYPKNAVETLAKRPMIMLIFGGGFIAGNRGQMTSYCKDFAKRGFVAVSIDYRLGQQESAACTDALSQEKGVYRAMQDARAAMRYMVTNAATYKIDTSWIFAGGYSAGAVLANSLVYVTQAEANSYYPISVSTLGGLDNSGNTLVAPFKVKGVFNNWGAITSDFFNVSEAVPTVSFHGQNDGVVPVDSVSEASCSSGNHYIYGSRALYKKLTAAGVCSDLTVQPGASHGVYQTPAGRLMRVNRATCFFKSVFCNSCVNYSALDSLSPKCSITTQVQNNFKNQNNTVEIYPNPSNSDVNIVLKSTAPSEIKLINTLGAIVLRDQNKDRIDISKLPNGIYFIEINQGDNFYSKKIIKQ